MNDEQRLAQGLKVRREVPGKEYVDREGDKASGGRQ